jgi:class 3 adenylate cyclase/tetratricopeptide (TPR) repeat protein
MICPSCGSENAADRKFCGQCGSALALVCPSCGSANEPGTRFCGECGAALVAVALPGMPAERVSERRLVSVLFADLVGFTALSEGRDAEEVRELLGRYFDAARRLVARYGGTVEKFIGDAVMAVWGTPVAQEDDAERAVRAALDLLAGVEALGEEVGAPDLRARAGVMTGEAAVTIGAEGQGMVAGDLVNTASRVQGAAEPGWVLVGESTRRATEAAVVYVDAGVHELKGKAEGLPLCRAVRVVAGRAGALRSVGLEAPFVGRDRELRTVKDLFHATAEERRAHLVPLVGIAGIGKSRLSWEFFKYIDGLSDTVYWHRGRCIAYGEGVTYWALAEMVRGRAGIVEGEDTASASAKLTRTVSEFVSEEERAWVQGRLAHLLGLEDRDADSPEDLFSAWRVFFERLADRHPTVLVFEDLQWADASLFEFIDYLLTWSRSSPLFVLALGRPEVSDRLPNWTAGRRGVTPIYLEPLAPERMRELLDGLVPGLPASLEERIFDRAQGVPLYAVETVRMLLDRGLLLRDGAAYQMTGAVDRLDVPETLHALIAARLDTLTPTERALLQDASVLGKTFSVEALSSLSGLPEAELRSFLSELVRKELLGVQGDPRSPERGQYGFLQDLVRRVAYETFAKRDRRIRHLAAAAFLEANWAGDDVEVAEIVASHYVEAYSAAPDAPDAAAIKGRARDALERAADRSASLAAAPEALRYYERAIELTDDPAALAELHDRAGRMGNRAGKVTEARQHFDRARDIYSTEGNDRAVALIEVNRGLMATADGRLVEAIERLRHADALLRPLGDDEARASVLAELARVVYFTGEVEEAADLLEQALTYAEKFRLFEVLSMALDTKAIVMSARGRREEALALMHRALAIALEHELTFPALRAQNNLVSIMGGGPLPEQLQLGEGGLALARRVGDRAWEAKFLAGSVPLLTWSGRWDEALARAEEVRSLPEGTLAAVSIELGGLPLIHVNRGETEAAARDLEFVETALAESEDVQNESMLAMGRSMLHRAQGRPREAEQEADRVLALEGNLSLGAVLEETLAQATDAALDTGGVEEAARICGHLSRRPPGRITDYGLAQVARLQARIDAASGQVDAAESGFRAAAAAFRDLGAPFHVAETLTEHAEWLASIGRAADADDLATEARPIHERLLARPWLERLDVLQGLSAAVPAVSSAPSSA